MIPVHIVTGFLGAGKTTLLLRELARRSETERSAIVVNDFGQARYDASRLDGLARVQDIPGGCLCCTAPAKLVPALEALLAEERPDRIFIEATGLARPADLVETLRRAIPAGLPIQLAPVVCVIDGPRLLAESPSELMQLQMDASDVWLLNRMGNGHPSARAHAERLAEGRLPPLMGLSEMADGAPTPDVFALGERHTPREATAHKQASTDGWAAASHRFPPEFCFDMGQLRTLLSDDALERVKGVFHTDIGWYRVERAGDRVEATPSPYRGGSHVDVIMKGTPLQAQGVITALDHAQWKASAPGAIGELELIAADGEAYTLDRAKLLALPEQVEDISTELPKRVGQGVRLSAILAMANAHPDATFIAAAADGLKTQPIPVAAVGDALVAHSHNDQAFPQKMGGPFRLLVPPTSGQSACTNVKKLIRLKILS